MAGATVTWTSSASSVATVDASGLVTAAGNGTATITASAGSASGSAVVTVTQSVASVEVSPATAPLTALGATVQLTAEAFDANGHAVAGAEFSWESSDVAVATVDGSGLVTAVSEGVATITASAGEVAGSAVVTVMQPVASVEVSPPSETIGLGSTLQLMAEGFDENGDAVAGVAFSWESSDVAVATVDNRSGLVTGVTVGVATITASAGSGQGMAEITVANLDQAVLIALYEATDGPNWVNSENWLTDEPLGEWYGVRTDASGRVVGLDLSGRWDSDEERLVRQGLVGSIPPELGSLTNLTALWLSHNNLAGPIPVELGNLTQLKSLHLDGNGFSGPIPPELGRLANLESLALEANQLTGPISPELGSLRYLRNLSLQANRLTGPIPPELGSLTHVRQLWLSSNRLTGPVPEELGSLANLEGLELSRNELGGPLPQSLLELTKLDILKFGENAGLCAPGTSVFATWLDGIENRDETTLYCNESDVAVLDALYQTAGGSEWTNSTGWRASPVLEGWYGVDADALGRVTGLDLSNNGLSGKIPASLTELTRLTVLRINGNDLSGRLHLALTALSLREFHYANTEICTPANGSFQEWLKTIMSHEGTGVECGIAFASLEVAEAAPLTSIGETVELSVTGVLDDATRQSVDPTLVEWQSSDPAVATVSEAVVTAVRGGNATITATYEEHTVKSVVSVWISTLSEGSVRVLYVVPADKEFRADYSAGISKAIVDVQGWYRRQLDGLTFDIYSVIPEPCHLPENEDYYSYTEVWEKVLRDVQPCAPVVRNDPGFIWALYVDVEEACDGFQALGRGGGGLTLLPGYDLALMQNPGTWTFCDVGTIERSYGSVLGGLAHELGHAFGLPHPPGCDENLPTCDYAALMAYGYEVYPDTYLRDDDEKVFLRRSPFIKP